MLLWQGDKMPSMPLAERPHTITITAQDIYFDTPYDWYGPYGGAVEAGIRCLVAPDNTMEVEMALGGFPKKVVRMFLPPGHIVNKDALITWTDTGETFRVMNFPFTYFDPTYFSDQHHIEFLAVQEF